jgi:ribose 5-phosphate isomerase RpiB
MDKIIGVWMKTPFDGGRHERRVKKISMIEQGLNPSEVSV